MEINPNHSFSYGNISSLQGDSYLIYSKYVVCWRIRTTWSWQPLQEQLFRLNGLCLLYSWAQYPVELCAPTSSSLLDLPDMFITEMWPVVEVRDSAVGTLIELWLTCCHGNSYSPTMGWKCFYLPVLHKQSGWSVWLQKYWPSSSISGLISLVTAKSTNTDELSGSRLMDEAGSRGDVLKKNSNLCWTK